MELYLRQGDVRELLDRVNPLLCKLLNVWRRGKPSTWLPRQKLAEERSNRAQPVAVTATAVALRTAVAVTVIAPAKDIVNNGRCCGDCSSSCCDKGRSCSDGRCCSEAVLFVATAVAPAPDDWLSGSGRLVVIRKSLLNVNKSR